VRSRLRLSERQGLREIGLVGICLVIYFLIRGFVADEFPEAKAHALGIIHLEQTLHVFWEPQIQRLLDANLFLTQLWNQVYFWGHAPVILVVAIWLYLRHRRTYALVRTAFLTSAIVGLLIYWLLPVAPPRLMAGYGFVDTMQRYSEVSYQAQSLKPFVNPYAAVPSLHIGFAIVIGVALVLALRNPIGWILGIALPALMLVAIIATANHFFFDAVAGLAVCLFGLLTAVVVQRWQHARERVHQLKLLPAEAKEAGEPATV
jgi:hypothetical protein